jgi:hypothetical protein
MYLIYINISIFCFSFSKILFQFCVPLFKSTHLFIQIFIFFHSHVENINFYIFYTWKFIFNLCFVKKNLIFWGRDSYNILYFLVKLIKTYEGYTSSDIKALTKMEFFWRTKRRRNFLRELKQKVWVFTKSQNILTQILIAIIIYLSPIF